MKYIKTYETTTHKYKLGDYVLIEDPLDPNEYYTVISQVRNSLWASYFLTTYHFESGEERENFPVSESEIIRKMTPEETAEIDLKRNIKKYNV